MRTRDGTVTAREKLVLDVVWLGGYADLSDRTSPEYGLVESRIARRLERAGLLAVDAGARATLTERGESYVRDP